MDEKKKLGEILLEAGVIDKFQLKSALAEQNKWGGRLGNHLVQMGILTEELLVKALSKQLKIPYIDLAQMTITPDVLELVPQEIAEKFHLVPVAVKKIANKKTLIVAMSDPTNLDAIDELQFRTGHIIKPAVDGDTAIEMAIRKYYYGETGPIVKPGQPIDFDPNNAAAPAVTNAPTEDVHRPPEATFSFEHEQTQPDMPMVAEASLADLGAEVLPEEAAAPVAAPAAVPAPVVFSAPANDAAEAPAYDAGAAPAYDANGAAAYDASAAPAYDASGAPAYDASGAPAYDASAAPAYDASAAPAYDASAAPAYDGSEVPAYDGTAAPAYDGSAAPAYDASAAPAYEGGEVPAYDGDTAPDFDASGVPAADAGAAPAYDEAAPAAWDPNASYDPNAAPADSNGAAWDGGASDPGAAAYDPNAVPAWDANGNGAATAEGDAQWSPAETTIPDAPVEAAAAEPPPALTEPAVEPPPAWTGETSSEAPAWSPEPSQDAPPGDVAPGPAEAAVAVAEQVPAWSAGDAVRTDFGAVQPEPYEPTAPGEPTHAGEEPSIPPEQLSPATDGEVPAWARPSDEAPAWTGDTIETKSPESAPEPPLEPTAKVSAPPTLSPEAPHADAPPADFLAWIPFETLEGRAIRAIAQLLIDKGLLSAEELAARLAAINGPSDGGTSTQ